MAWKATIRDDPPEEGPPDPVWSPSAPVAAVGLLGWIALTFCAPALGFFTPPGEGYEMLEKPAWNPPAWVFGPVWTVLYLLMAVAAWLVWKHGGWSANRRPLGFYLTQLTLNAAWTPAFFGLQNPGLALAVIVLLLAAIVATLKTFSAVHRTAAGLLVPYLLWVNFATVLNLTLWFMNR
ncbi:MAG: tryptophan-rich sensory protein [Verrucomicrobia bacterium]|nr:tryptophan-rich sensory protein [Verrucomicrobiota bacterium]